MLNMRFENKVAVVLGGSQGIGAATVRRLCQEGAQVVIGDINVDDGEQLAASLGAEVALFQQADMADKDSLLALIQSAESHFGGLDCLANVAFHGLHGDRAELLNIDEDMIDHYFTVNAKAFLVTCKAAIPFMLKRGGGGIVQVSSLSGQYGGAMSTMPLYGMLKASTDALTRNIAARYGKQNIRCNNVAPGTVMTEMVRANAHKLPDIDKMKELMPSPEFAEPEDIAAIIAFLLSSDARSINAQTIFADGGETAVLYPTQVQETK